MMMGRKAEVLSFCYNSDAGERRCGIIFLLLTEKEEVEVCPCYNTEGDPFVE
jgi:hypothetical protein